MKAKSLQTLAREAEREVSVVASPKISLNKALSSRFLWQKQEYTVGTCDLAILRAFLERQSISLLAQRPNKYDEALSCLDASYGALGRWQAIDTLLFYGVLLPLR